MIEKMGFTDYFLIVSDFVRYAKSVDIPVFDHVQLVVQLLAVLRPVAVPLDEPLIA